MKQEQTAILRGTLDMLILKSFLAGKMYGLGVSRRIQAFFRSSPARSQNNRRAKHYRLTKAGRKQLPKVGPNFLDHRASLEPRRRV